MTFTRPQNSTQAIELAKHSNIDLRNNNLDGYFFYAIAWQSDKDEVYEVCISTIINSETPFVFSSRISASKFYMPFSSDIKHYKNLGNAKKTLKLVIDKFKANGFNIEILQNNI